MVQLTNASHPSSPAIDGEGDEGQGIRTTSAGVSVGRRSLVLNAVSPLGHRMPAMLASPPAARGRLYLTNEGLAGGQFLVPTLTGYYWVAGLGDAIDPSGVEPEPEFTPLATPELLLDSPKVWLVLQGGEPVAGCALERTL
jgi:hypothetical protein